MKALASVWARGEAADLARTIDTRIDAIRKRIAGRPRRAR